MERTLAQTRDKANAILTPLYLRVKAMEAKRFASDGAYKAYPLRRLHLPHAGKFDVFGRVVADAKGYSFQVLVVVNGVQYARAQGEGTGVTFPWKVVKVKLPTTEDSCVPNAMKLHDIIEKKRVVGSVSIAF